jgi:hypothetical protein
VADGVVLQRLVLEQHGEQRRRIGWTPATRLREFALPREELVRIVRIAVRGTTSPPLEELLDLLGALMVEAERHAFIGFSHDAPSGLLRGAH